MRGKRTSKQQVARYTDLRCRGLKKYEASLLVGISRWTADRIEQTEAFKEAVASYVPPKDKPSVPLSPQQQQGLELAQAQHALEEELRNQPDVIGGVEVKRDRRSDHGDHGERIEEAPSFGYGTPESDPTPPEGIGPDGVTKRTWSPDDKHISPSDPDLVAAEKLADHYAVANRHLAEVRARQAEEVPGDRIRPGSREWDRRAARLRSARNAPAAPAGWFLGVRGPTG